MTIIYDNIKNSKYLGIYLVKYVEYIYAENYKTLLRLKKLKLNGRDIILMDYKIQFCHNVSSQIHL